MAIILASQSPRRRELLGHLVTDFQVLPADIDETVLLDEGPTDYVMRMANTKGDKVAKSYPDDLIISSDTIVVWDKQILGKPRDRKEAFEMLRQLSGAAHLVYTGVVLQKGAKRSQALTQAEVSFYDLTDAEINRYLDSGEYADKAGAYGIQGQAGVFVKEIQGDYYSIVGFPVGAVNQMLKEF